MFIKDVRTNPWFKKFRKYLLNPFWSITRTFIIHTACNCNVIVAYHPIVNKKYLFNVMLIFIQLQLILELRIANLHNFYLVSCFFHVCMCILLKKCPSDTNGTCTTVWIPLMFLYMKTECRNKWIKHWNKNKNKLYILTKN